MRLDGARTAKIRTDEENLLSVWREHRSIDERALRRGHGLQIRSCHIGRIETETIRRAVTGERDCPAIRGKTPRVTALVNPRWQSRKKALLITAVHIHDPQVDRLGRIVSNRKQYFLPVGRDPCRENEGRIADRCQLLASRAIRFHNPYIRTGHKRDRTQIRADRGREKRVP